MTLDFISIANKRISSTKICDWSHSESKEPSFIKNSLDMSKNGAFYEKTRRFWQNFSNKRKSGLYKKYKPLKVANTIKNYAFLLVRKQRVHTYSLEVTPLISTFTLWTLALKVRLVWRLEWLTLFPLVLPLPHITQTLLIISTSLGEFLTYLNNIPLFFKNGKQNGAVFRKYFI